MNKKILLSCWAKPLRNGKMNAKNPNKEWWNELIAMLKEKEYEVWQCGQGEEEKLENVDQHIWNKDLWQLGDEDILGCDVWISVDNFFPHWSLLQFKKPGIVIWGQSDPELFGHPANANLLKDRKYLRPKQFDVWESVEHNPDAFVSPAVVFAEVEKTINKNGGQNNE